MVSSKGYYGSLQIAGCEVDVALFLQPQVPANNSPLTTLTTTPCCKDRDYTPESPGRRGSRPKFACTSPALRQGRSARSNQHRWEQGSTRCLDAIADEQPRILYVPGSTAQVLPTCSRLAEHRHSCRPEAAAQRSKTAAMPAGHGESR